MSDSVINIRDHTERREAAALAARTPLLSARGLCFDAGKQRLINEVDLDILPGRCTVVMGANGSGKSLLLRLLHGLLPPSEGLITWRGRPLDRAARLEQAMVFQRPVMLRRSVAANLRFALKVRGVRGAERKAREAADALAKADEADYRFGHIESSKRGLVLDEIFAVRGEHI